MAVQKTDKKGHKDPDSFREHFKKVAKNENFLGPALISSGFLFIASAFGSAMTYSYDTLVPEADYGAYTGIFNQNRNYSLFGDGTLLFKNDEGYALYNQTGQRFILEEDREAAIEDIEGVIQQLTNYRYNIRDPFAETDLPIETCNYISRPFELSGQIERYESPDYGRRCEVIETTIVKAEATLREEAVFWQEALDYLRQEGSHYGIDAGDLTEASPEPYLERVAETTGTVTGGAALFWLLVGGAAAGVSRRKSIKSKSQKLMP